jgi:hypothetical protein
MYNEHTVLSVICGFVVRLAYKVLAKIGVILHIEQKKEFVQ